jgi:antitoxin MazE
MRTQLVKWGNSQAVRLPKRMLEQAQIADGAMLELAVRDGKIEISTAQPKLTLKALIDGITPENCHGEVSWGEPRGKEQW